MNCAICFSPCASVTVKALNGLPLGVVACDPCRSAVQRRDLGVSVRPNGELDIYGLDGRRHAHPFTLTAVSA